MPDLKFWLDRILNANSTDEIFSTLEEFRPLSWTDEERASMSKTYNAKLYQLNANALVSMAEKANKGKTISKQDAGNQRGESLAADEEAYDEEVG